MVIITNKLLAVDQIIAKIGSITVNSSDNHYQL